MAKVSDKLAALMVKCGTGAAGQHETLLTAGIDPYDLSKKIKEKALAKYETLTKLKSSKASINVLLLITKASTTAKSPPAMGNRIDRDVPRASCGLAASRDLSNTLR